MTRIRFRTANELRTAQYAGVIASDEWRRIVDNFPAPEAIPVEELTLEQYSNLANMADDYALVDYVCRCLCRRVQNLSAWRFIALLSGIVKGISKVQAAFEAIPEVELGADERQAGFGALKFGLFGVVDRLARRQGISDEQVRAMKVSAIIGKLRIDAEVSRCERRLAAIRAQPNYRRK